MKVVGLLSGGKDSCFNLCHCVLQGHEIVALATLAPPSGKDEIDSYMYQTVGHDAVHAVAAAMGLPLYRAEITGEPLNQGAVYGARDPQATEKSAGDETEDLYRLLCTVKAHHPDVEGVSVGAILSNYQRLLMQPLAFLWQRNQSHLLHEMNTSGLCAVILKVAGIGLTERDLGKTLQQLQPKLENLGGEYETLSLDSPLFVKRVELRNTETVIHSDAAFASVSYLRVPEAVLCDKEPGSFGQEAVHASMRAPPLLDPLGVQAYEVAHGGDQGPFSTFPAALPCRPTVQSCERGAWIAVGDVSGTGPSFEDEVRSALERLRTTLAAHGYAMTDICHMNVYLASQALFPTLNAIYCAQFGAAPPSRACVALPLGDGGVRVVLDAVAHRDTQPPGRRTLHVQSRSYWAPANIGPYSQAVNSDHRVWIAGQIGMEPTTLDVVPEPAMQVALALQHVRRIVLAVREWSYAPTEGYVEGGVCWIATRHAHSLSRAVGAVWHAEADDDSAHAHQQSDDTAWLGECRSPLQVPLLIVQLAPDALPKHAAVEWQLTASTGRSRFGPADDEEDAYNVPTYVDGSFVHEHVECVYRLAYVAVLGTACGVATLRATDAPDAPDAHSPLFASYLAQALHVRLVHAADASPTAADALLAPLGRATTHVPAYGWAPSGGALTADGAAIAFVC